MRDIQNEDTSHPNKNWENAKSHCDSLGNGWTLPEKDLLKAVYDKRETLGKTGSDNVFDANDYWSSTEYSSGTDGAWNVNFYDGDEGWSNKYNEISVLCTRKL